MKPANDFAFAMADLDADPSARLWYASRGSGEPKEADGLIELAVPFRPLKRNGTFEEDSDPHRIVTLTIRAYGDCILRLSAVFGDRPATDSSPMLDAESSLVPARLTVEETADSWIARDSEGRVRLRLPRIRGAMDYWSDEQPPAWPMLEAEFLPDGKVPVVLSSHDQFFPGKLDSVPLGFLEREGDAHSWFASFMANPGECYSGTGERFSKIDLSGRTVVLENTDGLGCNSRKTYKNVPFYYADSGYGVFFHTSCHGRISFADVSNRAVQSRFEDDRMDIFLIGGGSPEPVLRNYRSLTGFSPELPAWTYGIWMSRMTYFSADEVNGIVDRLREEEFPFDVIHLDTGWFPQNWICEWRFSEKTFPEPETFLRRLKERGVRVTLWQTPNIGPTNPLYEEALAGRIIPPPTVSESEAVSDFSGQEWGGQIDFTNPNAVAWYQDKLRGLLDLGVAAIKTDFGEKLDMKGDYQGIPADELHNLYGLLYQKAAYEVSCEYPGSEVIWARAGWAGCQRYPLHWGGDTSATWDGMASVLRGGLHLGLSGFTYWSHDIPGFHGLPEFMNTRPSEMLYLRWTQFGMLSSHARYHGTSAREPWEYPGVAELVKKWWRLRYSLIPYLRREGAHCAESGLPMMAALIFHHPSDPAVRHIDDEYYLGRDLLTAPVMNEEGVRRVYIPEGSWIDFFTGEALEGGRWLETSCPPAACPLYVREGARLPVYPVRVGCTDEMDDSGVVLMEFDLGYRGVADSILAEATGFVSDDFIN